MEDQLGELTASACWKWQTTNGDELYAYQLSYEHNYHRNRHHKEGYWVLSPNSDYESLGYGLGDGNKWITNDLVKFEAIFGYPGCTKTRAELEGYLLAYEEWLKHE